MAGISGRYAFHGAGSTQGTSDGLDGQDNPDKNLRKGTNRAVGIMLERPQDLFAGMETPRIHASRRCLTSQSQDREFSFLRFRHLPETTGDRGPLVPAGVGPGPSGMPTAMFLVPDFT